MTAKTRIIFKIFLTIALVFVTGLFFSTGNPVEAAEIISTDWVLNSNKSKLTVSDVTDGGVATISYSDISSNASDNSVTLKISNYDIVDNRLSIKYQADFPVSGNNITIEISYSSGSDENTGEDYEGGKILVGWFENWNVESGKTRDGYDLITLDFSSYTNGKTVNGIVFTFAYSGTSTLKTINFLGVDFHPDGVTPQFVTDAPITEGSVYLGLWTPDAEVGNMQYSTAENGDTTIHYSAAPNGKSRIVAPLYGHDLTLLPTLKIKYSCTKSFNLAVYINGTSTSLLSYTNITDNDGYIELDLSKTTEKLCIIVDRENYCDKSTYPSSDPTKDIYLEFYFIDQQDKEIKVHSVANNNGGNSNSGSGNEDTGSESGSTTPTTPSTGNITIAEFTNKKSEAGNLETSLVDGTHVFYFPSAPTSKSRVYAEVSGHSYAAYPTLQITYSCTKSFNLAVYVNGTSNSLIYYIEYKDNTGVITLDLAGKGDVTELVIMVDRNGKHDPSSYTEDDPTKTVYLKFEFLDANGNPAGSDNGNSNPESGNDNTEGGNQGTGSESGSTPTPSGDVIIGSWENDSAGNMQYSINSEGQTVINFSSEPTGKSRIFATVTGHDVSSYPILQIKYSCTKEFNMAVYINGTSTSLLSYADISDNNGIIELELTTDMEEIYLMIDRSGYHNSDTYTEDDPTKTIYLEFTFLSSKGD